MFELFQQLNKTRASGRNVGKVFNPVVKLVLENQPFLMPEPAEKPSLHCSSKLSREAKAIIYTKCGAFMRPDRCPLSATVKLLSEANDGVQYSVTAFGSQVLAAASASSYDDIESKLVSAEPGHFVIKNGIYLLLYANYCYFPGH